MLNINARQGFDESHEQCRRTVRMFIAKEVEPFLDEWEEKGITSKSFWRRAGEVGLLCSSIPEAYGGAALDISCDMVFMEELFYCNAPDSVSLQSLITAPYLLKYGSEKLKARYLPGMISGKIISALGMTEPGGGSDAKNMPTTARRWRPLCHQLCHQRRQALYFQRLAFELGLSRRAHRGRGRQRRFLDPGRNGIAGLQRGRNLDKIGMSGADTSELFFNDVRVKVSKLLGEDRRGFSYMMFELGQNRLAPTAAARCQAQRAFARRSAS